MKINLHILWDDLQKYGGEIICSDDIRSHLSGVRLLETARSALSQHYVYVVEPQLLERFPAAGGPYHFVCTGAVDQSLLDHAGWAAIVLPGAADRCQVFQEIQEIFEKYNQWEQDVLLAVANDRPLQVVFDLGVRFLRNPVALFDIRQAFITMSGKLPENYKNTIWEEVLTRQSVQIEKLSDHEQRKMARALADRDEPFFYQNTENYTDHQQMVTSLKRSGVPFATLGSIDIAQPFTLGQLAIFSHLKNFLELAIKNDLQLASIAEGSSYYVDRLLQGFSVERSAVEYHLSRNHWRLEDEYCLLFCTRTDGTRIDEVLNKMYAFRIRSMLGDAIVFPYENGILAISHNDNRVRADREFVGGLTQLIEKLGLRCGVSLPFEDFLNLKYAYIQCKTALASAAEESTETITLFETRYTDHILKALNTATSLKSLCHPQILRMAIMDAGKGKEFVQSLQAYLQTGRNTTTAARQLYIHRNTLLYRLKRIEETLGIDLEAANEQTLFMLQLSCLIAQSSR